MSQNVFQVLASALSTMSCDLDMKGGGTWEPRRNPKKNYDKWGVWEAWCYFRFGKINECLVGPIPTGDWVAWNSETKQVVGFTNCSKMTAQAQAEMLCASQNQGMPTRVVDITGRASESVYTLRDAERMLGDIARKYDEGQRLAREDEDVS